MERLKREIIEEIEKEKEIKLREYDKHIDKIRQEDDIGVYTHLVEVYGNNMKQGEIGIKYLRSILGSEFFKESEVLNGANYIVFKGKDIEVHISKSRVKQIEIKHKRISKKSKDTHRYLDSRMIELADAVEEYTINKTPRKFRKIMELNDMGLRRGVLGFICKVKAAQKISNAAFVQEVRERQQEDMKKRIEVEKEKIEIEKKQIEIDKIVSEVMPDLRLFEENGWGIKIKGEL